MAFPTTISTGADAATGVARPYLSSGGNVYVILHDDVTLTKIRAFKATDPTSSFSNVGTDVTVTSGNSVRCIATVQDGDNIHVVTRDATGSASTNDLRYHIFSMASDSWTTTNEAVVTGFAGQSANDFLHVSVNIRSDGDVIVLYNGATVANMGANRARVYYARRESAVWTVDVAVDNGGATHWYSSDLIRGSSDRMHLFFFDDTADDAYQRALTSANGLQTFPASYDDTAYANREGHLQLGASYDASGTQKVRLPKTDTGGLDMDSAKLDSADSPTPTLDADITGATNVTGTKFTSSFSANGTTLWHAFIAGGDTDIYTQSNANDAGWSAPASFYVGTATNVFTNIYTRNGDIVLAMVFIETDPKYHEKLLSAGDTSLFQVDFEMDFGKGRIRGRR